MAPTVESQYKELLNPVKDPQKSFEINIADLLQDYISNVSRYNFFCSKVLFIAYCIFFPSHRVQFNEILFYNWIEAKYKARANYK